MMAQTSRPDGTEMSLVDRGIVQVTDREEMEVKSFSSQVQKQ